MNTKDNKFPSKIQELAYEFKIQEAMSSDVITVKATDSMGAVRRLLLDNRISGLPVTDQDKLVGIISLDNFITCIMDEGMNDEEARAFQGYFVRGTVVFTATAVVAHLLVWMWRPWY